MSDIIFSGRYEVLDTLGSGGVATVYKVRDNASGDILALKLLHSHLSDDPDAMQRLQREIELSKSIDHPGIIKCHDVEQDGSQLYFTMEYLPGGDLKERIFEFGSLPLNDSLDIAIAVLDALDSAHRMGIVHCDIKPQNILFDEDNRPRISDFGFARSIAVDQQLSDAQNSGAGTPEYAAPELMTGALPDPRVDIYSLGISLFEMICGRTPFHGNNPRQAMGRQLREGTPDIRDYQSDVQDVVARILKKATARFPGERFQSAAEFAQALKDLHLAEDAALSAAKLCPVCGSPISPHFPLCPGCGRREVRIDSLTEKQYSGTADILITGPGQPGDRMNLEFRHQLLERCKAMGATSRVIARLEKSVPRLPFYLVKKLPLGIARELGAQLGEHGFELTVVSDKTSRHLARRGIAKKFLALYPRILLIGLATSAGAYMNILRNLNFTTISVLAAVLLVGLPVAITASYQRSLLEVKKNTSRVPVAALTEYAVEIPEARAIIQRMTVALKEREVAGESRKTLEQMSDGVLSMLEQLKGVSREMKTLPPGEADMYRRMQSTMQIYLDRLLRHSLTLERLQIAQARLEDQADAE